ncbi:MAG: S-methyl-5-thioribose-1-phosphate isomerase [Candidatus Thermoplasmatota archaeon]
MIINGESYRSVWFEKGDVKFIDQRSLPNRFRIFTAKTVEDVAYAIKNMVVRGAPAIGAAAAYGIALGYKKIDYSASMLRSTRPTAHDLYYAIDYMKKRINEGEDPIIAASTYVDDIIDRCRRIGEHGEHIIKDDMNILTHCNAGALATVDHGTALAPLRCAYHRGKKFMVYVDETRPRLQGLLTAWELKQENIPYSLIVDNAAGYLMEKKEIDCVIVGADRVTRNGDIANKIGTYEKAVCAKENNIPFYVAAPSNTFDANLTEGSMIPIEERNPEELTTIRNHVIMPKWINVKNPAFDITPSRYITGYITENGVFKKPQDININMK